MTETRSMVEMSDLTPDPRNARKHSDRNREVLRASIVEVGAARSIVIDEDGVILAGNATVEAARAAGLTKLHVVDADGDTLVAVRRSGLSAREKTRLALADNRAAELAGWDADVLAGVDRQDLASLWDDAETDILLRTRLVTPEVAEIAEIAEVAEVAETERFALAIVLTASDMRTWRAYKDGIDKQADTAAFRELLRGIK